MRAYTRLLPVLFGLGLSCPVQAQTVAQASPGPGRQATDAAAVTVSDEDLGTDQARPLATRENGRRIVSRNEAYNRARAAEGRVGVRLGNDMSFRITD